MGTWLEGDVGCGALNFMIESSGLLEGCDLGVVPLVVEMGAFTDEEITTREYAANGWVG
jgi:hypothetical protein